MTPEQNLRKRLEEMNFFDDVDEKLKQFCKNIRKLLRDNFDEVVAISGDVGLGKSQLGTIIGLLVDFDYSFDRNVVFLPTPEQIKSLYYKLPPRSVLHIDEASASLHKHKWMDRMQQQLNLIYDIDRENHFLCSILILPRFSSLNENFRNHRVKFWLNIIRRGTGIAYIRESCKDSKDPWNIDANYKLKQKSWGRKKIFERGTDDIIYQERKLKNFFFNFDIPQIPESIWKEYQILKAESRLIMQDNEQSMEMESYHEKQDRERLAKWTRIMELRDKKHTLAEIGELTGVSEMTVRRNIKAMEVHERMKSIKINKEIEK